MTYNDILLNICHEISIQIPLRCLSPEELNRNALLKDDISLYILRADYWSSCYSEYVKTNKSLYLVMITPFQRVIQAFSGMKHLIKG